jgi:ABC-type uncharacterized transport system permease subunit
MKNLAIKVNNLNKKFEFHAKDSGTGILFPSSGKISVLGLNPQSDRKKLAYKIGTVFGQRSQLFPNLPAMVSKGDFDKYMLSPKNTLMRVATSRFIPSALGDLTFGAVSIVVWLYLTGFSLQNLFLIMPLALISASIYFTYSVFVNSLAFYFYDSRPIVQSFFEFLMTPSIFYGGAFSGITKIFYIFIIPALLLGTLPLELLKNFDITKFATMVVLTIFWFFLSTFVFYCSVRKYESSNFINFG